MSKNKWNGEGVKKKINNYVYFACYTQIVNASEPTPPILKYLPVILELVFDTENSILL